MNEWTNERIFRSIPFYNHRPIFCGAHILHILSLFRSRFHFLFWSWHSMVLLLLLLSIHFVASALFLMHSPIFFRFYKIKGKYGIKTKFHFSANCGWYEQETERWKYTWKRMEKSMECLKLWVQNVKSRIQVKWCRSQKSVSTSMANIAVSLFSLSDSNVHIKCGCVCVCVSCEAITDILALRSFIRWFVWCSMPICFPVMSFMCERK